MTEKEFIQKMADGLKNVPATIEIPALRQFTPDLAQKRAERFTRLMAPIDVRFASKSSRVMQQQRTLYRLPLNARLEVHHVSGDMRFVSGLAPMESIFSKIESREVLTRNLEEAARKLDLGQWAAKGENVQFERLWQIKAAAVDQQGKNTQPVLCRAVGAYRHQISGIPVLGAASAVIRLAGNLELDAVTVGVRETEEKRLGSEKVTRVDDAAQRLYAQLSALMGKSKMPAYEMATPQWVRFGYLAQARRQAQRTLIPVFMAAIDIKAEDMAQGYLLTVPATTNPLLMPILRGADLPTEMERRVSNQNNKALHFT